MRLAIFTEPRRLAEPTAPARCLRSCTRCCLQWRTGVLARPPAKPKNPPHIFARCPDVTNAAWPEVVVAFPVVVRGGCSAISANGNPSPSLHKTGDQSGEPSGVRRGQKGWASPQVHRPLFMR